MTKARKRKRTVLGMVGSANAFADLELPNAGVRLLKAFLAGEIMRALAEQELTDQAATAATGETIETLETILRGRHDRIEAVRLARILAKLGISVRISVRAASMAVRAGRRRRTIKAGDVDD